MRNRLARLPLAWRRHGGVVVVLLAAFAVRLVWNLAFHPPGDFVISDMGGYLSRADEIFKATWKPQPYLTLFPWGTHAFVFLIKAAFGRTNKVALGVAFAALGALAVAFTYATAGRLYPRRPWVRRALGALLVVYYPWISLSGYVLSEAPFALAVAATAFTALRLADRGRAGDAWLLGAWAAFGTLIRPQMLLSVALIGVHALVRRRAWRRLRARHAVYAAVPIALVLAVSIARVEFHTGHFGLVSTNGPLNYAFGRCHATTIEAKARDGGGYFGPPPLGALLAYQKKRPHALFTLDPANGPVIRFKGHMWDADRLDEIARDCIARTGWLKQAYYAATHVVLLYGYNTIWPDSGIAGWWRSQITVWCHAQIPLVVPAVVVAFVRAHRRRRARELLVAAHLWALLGMAVLYFGDTRYRAPYDGIVFLLVVPLYADVFRLAARGARALLQRVRFGAVARVAPAPPPEAATIEAP